MYSSISQVRVTATAASLLLFLGLIADGAQAGQSAAKTAPKPKISSKQAETVAVKKIGGKVISSKYEFEDGRWQYAVLVNDKKGQMYEVEVNSTTGKVMDTEKTSAEAEVKEEMADKKAAAGKGASKPNAKEDKEDGKNG